VSQMVAVVTQPSTLAVTLQTPVMTTPVGGTWLSASLNSTTGVLTVSATTGSLQAGTYNGYLTLTASGAANLIIPVSFVVGSPATINVNPSATASFSAVINNLSPPAAQALLVTVANGPIPMTLTGTIPAWLTATLVPSGVSTSTASLNLSINQAAVNSLAVGSYSATLTIGTSVVGVAPVTVTVNLAVTAVSISANQTTATFPFTLGGVTTAQTQTVTLTGTPGALFNISTAGCGTWLSTSQTSGVLPGQVILSVAPGSYTTTQTGCVITYGITGNTASASTAATMTINAQPVVTQPATDSFSYVWQGTVPSAHSLPVTVANATSVTGLLLTPTGSCAWLTNSLASTTAPTSINTSINAAGVPSTPGVYTCTLTLSAGTGGNPVAPALYTTATTVTLNLSPLPFFNGEYNGGGGMLLLHFPDGTSFGYFAYLGGSWIYQLDLGYESVIPANDASNGVYMYDLKSGHWFYTNPGSFPYLYDFTLRAWLYYFPSSTLSDRYLSNPRYFANMTTGLVFTM
jgi:hypothetical protein